jgi:hypothetical protein
MVARIRADARISFAEETRPMMPKRRGRSGEAEAARPKRRGSNDRPQVAGSSAIAASTMIR